MAPGYRLFGSSAWAMEAGTVIVQMAWISVALWIGHRRAGHGRRGGRRRRPGRVAPGLRPHRARAAVEPVPAAVRLGRDPARHLVGAVRRPHDVDPARRRCVVRRPDPHPVPDDGRRARSVRRRGRRGALLAQRQPSQLRGAARLDGRAVRRALARAAWPTRCVEIPATSADCSTTSRHPTRSPSASARRPT